MVEVGGDGIGGGCDRVFVGLSSRIAPAGEGVSYTRSTRNYRDGL